MDKFITDNRVFVIRYVDLFEMADCNEKCASDCSFDYSEDKQKGVCLIKQE